ncbi:hypothetical protein CCHL11_06844 [Colletotrichum chlorophyti]|uniref:SMP-30/Gluconolactonase/LRE-like region domain-containing protein n=1 Tax=Colletotrichum chlorophyti TaxID=708187 RepID=A0A1Q8S9E2_9PEZI|nr:hypothetical protein CCHL11_06844 [Colletotrichum chlorophyti]
MATIKETGIRAVATPVQTGISIIQYDAALESVIGPKPTHALVLSSAEGSAKPFFHHGCVYLPSRNELWTTSAPLAATDPTRPPTILMSKVIVTRDPHDDETLTVEWAKVRPPPAMAMPASGCALANDGMFWCSQGTEAPGTGGIFFMPMGRPPQPVAATYYGRDFNSPRSVAVSPRDAAIWFTDPCCGHEQGFRGAPQLPPQVYRCDTKTWEVRAVADGFVRPTGIAIDEGFKTLYVADAGGAGVDEELDLRQPRSIYAFDIMERQGSVFLANKRLFALARQGAPMHLMCEGGNLLAAGGDGVEIWSAGGSLLGLIQVPGELKRPPGSKAQRLPDANMNHGTGGVMSFCRGTEDSLFLCAGQRLWRLQLSGGLGQRPSSDPELL